MLFLLPFVVILVTLSFHNCRFSKSVCLLSILFLVTVWPLRINVTIKYDSLGLQVLIVLGIDLMTQIIDYNRFIEPILRLARWNARCDDALSNILIIEQSITIDYSLQPSALSTLSQTRKPCYRKDDRAMRPLYGCPEKFRKRPKFVKSFCSDRY